MLDNVGSSFDAGFGVLHPAGDIRIVASPYWPKVPDGVEIKRIPAHPIVHWLARRGLPIDPWVEISVPKFKYADPIVYEKTGTLYCSPAQAREISQGFH